MVLPFTVPVRVMFPGFEISTTITKLSPLTSPEQGKVLRIIVYVPET